ncbi:hypothetical protein IFT80_10030 [Pseudomonas sp. CFBP 8771]|uniref:hypothetical protein n=1 Tax=unclassified Pseudomonas TaxID=196821 RepID=UPI00177B6CC3|nr:MULTISPECIES: hypothetical protein [unclassified Pseudomonas]MBD8602966.1 hypothetical protein [Pseudomonas sp. CFBP 8771]MBD8826640.1 hypothetical protein [Pseudomonas sp. CFBP 13602]
MKQLCIIATLIPLSVTANCGSENCLSFPPAYSRLTKVDLEDWESVTKEFRDNALWNQNTTEIQSCESLYTLPVTTSREGNVSFGGICTIAGSGQKVFICTDRMLGRFEVFPEFQRDLPWIAQKIFDNCWGG